MFSGVEISEANGRTEKTFLTASGKNTSGITAPEVSCTIALFTCHKPNIFVVIILLVNRVVNDAEVAADDYFAIKLSSAREG